MDTYLRDFLKLDVFEKRKKVIEIVENAGTIRSDSLIFLLKNENDPYCKWHLIKALGNYSSEEVGDILIGIFYEDDVDLDGTSLHLCAANSIGKIGRSMTDRVLSLLKNDDEIILKAAIDTLGVIGDPKSIHYLIPFISDNRIALNVWAGLSLGKIGSDSVEPLMKELSIASEDKTLIILDALSMIDFDNVISEIIKVIKRYPDISKKYFVESRPQNAVLFVYEAKRKKGLDKRADEFINMLNLHEI